MYKEKALVFTRNFPYNLGGAERSLLEELKHSTFHVSEIHYANQNKLNTNVISDLTDLDARVKGHDCFKLLPRFFYYEYLVNKGEIYKIVKDSDFDVLISQNRWAPAALNAANSIGKETVYYLRDETSIGILNNYYSGFKRFSRDIYKTLELPAIKIFNNDNILALNNASKVISNSNYISSRLWDKYKVDSIVSYPKIDKNALIKYYSYNISNNEKTNDGIVIIGDTKIKGIDVVMSLAKDFPEQKFYIFGKNLSFKCHLKNVFHLGWASDSSYPYSRAKVVLVPSLWEEAFGRVAVEARLLDIPVIVSNRGGLPEAVDHDSNMIADTYNEFKRKLRIYI